MAPPQVTIEQGTLQGSTGTDLRGDSFYKFQGIPFAKPPIGELRFKAPVAPEKWAGVFDATKEGDECKQRDPMKEYKITGSENCLTLNVFTKQLADEPSKDLRPVMVWIPGGGLVFGSSREDMYGPEYLITEDIVLVSFNYRLGLLGFLSLEDPALEIPGNAGFKDQVMALKWVQKNIDKFGGDPNNVTIFGESAGGGSVHAQVLSPLSKGLFHRAIAQSGCALNPWIKAAGLSKALATVLNLEGADEKTIHQELLKKSEEEIIEIQDKLGENFDPNSPRLFGLVIEKNSKEPFMVEEPIKALQSRRFNQVPFMIGYTSCEAMLFDLFSTPEQKKVLDFEKCVPWFFGYSLSESKTVANKLKKYYFGNEKFSQKTISKKYDLISDVQFLFGIHLTALNHYSKVPTYLYKLTAETELNFFKKYLKITEPGVSHLDDIGYLFKTVFSPEVKPGSIEDICLRRMVKLWTNFAKFADPTPEKDDPLLKTTWKPVTDPSLKYLEIGKELVVKYKPESERIAFWAKLFMESPAGQKSGGLY